MDRQVARTEVDGIFPLPMGLHLFQREEHPKRLVVSTVQLDGGHLEDPLGICKPETGFETMVFLDGCSFFSLHTRHYETRAQAKRGHEQVLKQLYARKLTLSVEVKYYHAREPFEAVAA